MYKIIMTINENEKTCNINLKNDLEKSSKSEKIIGNYMFNCFQDELKNLSKISKKCEKETFDKKIDKILNEIVNDLLEED